MGTSITSRPMSPPSIIKVWLFLTCSRAKSVDDAGDGKLDKLGGVNAGLLRKEFAKNEPVGVSFSTLTFMRCVIIFLLKLRGKFLTNRLISAHVIRVFAHLSLLAAKKITQVKKYIKKTFSQISAKHRVRTKDFKYGSYCYRFTK